MSAPEFAVGDWVVFIESGRRAYTRIIAIDGETARCEFALQGLPPVVTTHNLKDLQHL
jgi:hypothetical protein